MQKTKNAKFPPIPDGTTLNDILATIAPGARKLGLPPSAALGLLVAQLCKGIFAKLDERQFRQLRKYAKDSGQHMDDVIYEALDEHLTTFVETYYEHRKEVLSKLTRIDAFPPYVN